MDQPWNLTDEELDAQIRAARRRGRREARIEPRAVSAAYDAHGGRVLVELKNGCVFGFPPAMVPGLEAATPQQLATVEVWDAGEALAWDDLDAHVSFPGLMLHALNAREWAAKYLGSRTSPQKAAAARENGKKGGRPRKRADGGAGG